MGSIVSAPITIELAKEQAGDRWDQERWDAVVSSDGTVPAHLWNAECLPETRLRIVHINDVYELDPFPRLKTLIDQQRAAYKNCLVVLPGDFLAPSLLSSLDQGAGMVCCLNRVGVDLVCFGNHENDVDIASLRKRVAEFKGDWLNSNMPGFEPQLPKHVTKELVGEDGSVGTREVGFLGLLIGGKGFEATYRAKSFGGASESIAAVLSCHESAAKSLREAHPGVDCIIPLTHQDLAEDRAMAATGGYPIIIGGHDHDVIQEVVPVTTDGEGKSVTVVKAGMNAVKAAMIDLVWQKGAARGAAPTVSVELVDVASYAVDPATMAAVDVKLAPVRALSKATLLNLTPAVMERFGAQQVDGKLTLSSKRTRFGPSTFATFLATLGAKCMGVDFAAINAGAVRGAAYYQLAADGGTGKVSFADLQKECPFPSSVVITTCSGAVLAAAVEGSRAGWYEAEEPVESSQALHCDLRATVKLAADGKGCSLAAVGGAPLEPEKLYTALLDSYDIKKNPALAAWKAEHPEPVGYFPPDDAGRPMLPILVERLAKMLYLTIVDSDGDGDGSNADEIDAVFAKFDGDGDGLTSTEIAEALKSKLGEGASSLVASTMLSIADADGIGSVSKAELMKVMQSLTAK